jgi:hypothetical protein
MRFILNVSSSDDDSVDIAATKNIGEISLSMYGVNHLETMTFVQVQNWQ